MGEPVLTGADPARIGPASSFFIAFDKLLRASRLYEGHGPLVDRLGDTLLERAGALLADGDITVRVAPFGLLYAGEQVSEVDDQFSKALFRLFCDGVRELTFRTGLTRDELVSLADLLNTDPKGLDEDLITLLWKRDLKHIRYYATDTLQEGVDVEGAEGLSLAAAADGAQLRGDATGSEVVLSPDDLRMLKADDRLVWVRGATAPRKPPKALRKTADLVRKSFIVPGDQARFVNMAIAASKGRPSPMVLSLYDGLLASKDAAELAALMGAVAEVEAAGPGTTKGLRKAMLNADRIGKMAPVFEASSELLAGALNALSKDDREPLLGVLTKLRPGPAQTTLRTLLEKSGIDLTPFYAARLESEDTDVVVDAIAALGAIGSQQAVQALSVGLGNTLTPIRRAALDAMVGKYDPESRIALGRALRDPDRDNRLLSLQVLQKSGDPRVGGLVLRAAQHGTFRGRDEEEQAAVVDALSAFPNRRVLAWFGATLGEKNITRSKGTLQLQLKIVAAAASMGTAEAKELVETEARRWHLPKEVKDAAAKALRGWVLKEKPDQTYTGWTQEMQAVTSGEMPAVGDDGPAELGTGEYSRPVEPTPGGIDEGFGPDVSGEFSAPVFDDDDDDGDEAAFEFTGSDEVDDDEEEFEFTGSDEVGDDEAAFEFAALDEDGDEDGDDDGEEEAFEFTGGDDEDDDEAFEFTAAEEEDDDGGDTEDFDFTAPTQDEDGDDAFDLTASDDEDEDDAFEFSAPDEDEDDDGDEEAFEFSAPDDEDEDDVLEISAPEEDDVLEISAPDEDEDDVLELSAPDEDEDENPAFEDTADLPAPSPGDNPALEDTADLPPPPPPEPAPPASPPPAPEDTLDLPPLDGDDGLDFELPFDDDLDDEDLDASLPFAEDDLDDLDDLDDDDDEPELEGHP